jgi:hypothetical protein
LGNVFSVKLEENYLKRKTVDRETVKKGTVKKQLNQKNPEVKSEV